MIEWKVIWNTSIISNTKEGVKWKTKFYYRK